MDRLHSTAREALGISAAQPPHLRDQGGYGTTGVDNDDDESGTGDERLLVTVHALGDHDWKHNFLRNNWNQATDGLFPISESRRFYPYSICAEGHCTDDFTDTNVDGMSATSICTGRPCLQTQIFEKQLESSH